MLQNKPHIDEIIIMQFLLGELSQSEMLIVDEWLNASVENQRQLDLIEKIWIETGKVNPAPVAVDKLLAWQKLSARVDASENEKSEKQGKVLSISHKIVRFVYAAAAVLVIAFGVFKLVIQSQIPVKQLTFSSSQSTFNGKLPDGSAIALNLNSKISFPEKFDRKFRKVELEGESFFDVQHNTKQPFIIKAGNANIKVMGTSFNVKAVKGNNVEVSVSTGKVMLFKVDSLSGDTAAVYLTAGQKGVLPQTGQVPVKLDDPIEPDELFWMDRTLVFKQIELSKVFALLEKHYNVSITLENPMALNCTYTATFTNTDIKQILDMLAGTFNFAISQNGNSFVLKGNGCLDD